MRIIYVLLAVACLMLVGCNDNDKNVNLGQNGGGNGADNGGNNGDGDGDDNDNDVTLNQLVYDQCRLMPPDEDSIPINGRSFSVDTNNPDNKMFINTCLDL